MNINISRLEKYILYDFGLYTFGSKPSAKNYFLRLSFTGCIVIGLLLLFLFFSVLPRIENISPHFLLFLLLLLIPITAALTIKMCNRSMNSAKWDTNSGISAAKKWVIKLSEWLVALSAWPVLRALQNATIELAFFTLGGLWCVRFTCKYFHKVYLIRKYAPYFHDERLRAPEREADITK